MKTSKWLKHVVTGVEIDVPRFRRQFLTFCDIPTLLACQLACARLSSVFGVSEVREWGVRGTTSDGRRVMRWIG